MACAVSASSGVAAIAAASSSTSANKVVSNVVGAVKASFLSGRAVVVRRSRAVSSAANGGESMTVNVVAVAPSDRPLWI